MPLYKQAQQLLADDFENFGDEDEVVLYEDKPSMEDVVELHQPDSDAMEITFKLPTLPGSDAEMPLEVSTEDPVEVQSKGKKEKDDNKAVDLEVMDPWKSPAPGDILAWVHERLQNLPRHSGKETTGIERTIAAMKRINQEISKAIANDYDGKVDIARLENARREIFDGIHRLEDAKDKIEESSYKRKKAVVEDDGLVKEGKKTTHVGGIIITVPLLISNIARTAINSTVSAGKDLEITVAELVKKYALSDREQMELFQLLRDMNYPLGRPRGSKNDEKIDTKS